MELLPAGEERSRSRWSTSRTTCRCSTRGRGTSRAEVVFVGYGITAPELGRDDYAGLDVKGKVVMAVRGAPDDGRDWLAHNSHRARTANARAHGAAGYLFAESAVANPNGEPIADLPMADVSEEIGNTLLAGTSSPSRSSARCWREAGWRASRPAARVHLAVAARPARSRPGRQRGGLASRQRSGARP